VYHGPRTAKYSFKPKGIDFGIQTIDKGTSATILVVDEIGHLELRAEGFVQILELIKGRGEVASEVAHRLFHAHFKVYLSEASHPKAVSREDTFSEAMYDGKNETDGIVAKLVESASDILRVWEGQAIRTESFLLFGALRTCLGISMVVITALGK